MTTSSESSKIRKTGKNGKNAKNVENLIFARSDVILELNEQARKSIDENTYYQFSMRGKEYRMYLTLSLDCRERYVVATAKGIYGGFSPIEAILALYTAECR